MKNPIDVGMAPLEHMRAMNELFPTTTTVAALEAMEALERVRGTSGPGLTLDILLTLPRLSSSALRKIADECERSIRERMEDGMFD